VQLVATPSLHWPKSELTGATLVGTSVTVALASGEPQIIPLVWLRDNCVCSECEIASTGERRYFLGHTATAPTATELTFINGALRISWADGHVSTFTSDDFARLTHIADRSHVQAQLWAADFEPQRFDRADILNDAPTRVAFLSAAMRDGMTIVTNMGSESGECIRFLDALKLPVRDTPFDRLHDVFLRTDGYNVAHTAEALPPHNDFASYAWPPSGQLIHMLINEVAGGEWVNVDGFRVLDQLWRTHPDAVQTLARVPMAFREHSDTAESWTRAPIVRIDGQGNIIGLRFSNQLMQPMSPVDPNVVAFYEAYQLLARAISDPANQISLRGHAGTMQFLHAHRVLHARRAFDSSGGARHLQDTYFDFDDVASLVALTSGAAR